MITSLFIYRWMLCFKSTSKMFANRKCEKNQYTILLISRSSHFSKANYFKNLYFKYVLVISISLFVLSLFTIYILLHDSKNFTCLQNSHLVFFHFYNHIIILLCPFFKFHILHLHTVISWCYITKLESIRSYYTFFHPLPHFIYPSLSQWYLYLFIVNT